MRNQNFNFEMKDLNDLLFNLELLDECKKILNKNIE